MLNIEKHLNEFKYKIFYISLSFFINFVFSYINVQNIIYLCTLPLLKYKKLDFTLNQYDFIFTNVFEAFSSYTFLSFVMALYLTLPVILYISSSFISSGLTKSEKTYMNFLLRLILLFCVLAIVFTFEIFLPSILKFFVGFENLTKTNLFTLKLEPKILDYVHLTVAFVISLTAVFQIPIILLLIVNQTFINFTIFEKNRRLIFLVFIIFGGIFSPPEVFAQLIVAFPLCLFFEVSVFLSYLKKYYNKM